MTMQLQAKLGRISYRATKTAEEGGKRIKAIDEAKDKVVRDLSKAWRWLLYPMYNYTYIHAYTYIVTNKGCESLNSAWMQLKL